MAAPTEGLLLPSAADVVDRGLPEPHNVEGVQDPHRVGQAAAQGGGVAAERVKRGGRGLHPPGRVLHRHPLLLALLSRPGTTSSGCARARSGPGIATMPVTNCVCELALAPRNAVSSTPTTST